MNVVKNGSTGSSVIACQAILKAYGFVGKDGKPLDVDGVSGENTVYAINSFQSLTKSTGVNTGNCDGVFGAKCWEYVFGGD